MKRLELGDMTIDQIIEEFARIGIEQDDAEIEGNTSRYNKLYRRIVLIDQELRARGPEARKALSQLYNHPNIQVRLNAATRTLGVLPAEARALLERIRKAHHGFQSLDAGMRLNNLDEGIFKPD